MSNYQSPAPGMALWPGAIVRDVYQVAHTPVGVVKRWEWRNSCIMVDVEYTRHGQRTTIEYGPGDWHRLRTAQ